MQRPDFQEKTEGDWKPKFRGFTNMMYKLERIMCIGQSIQQFLDEEAMVKE